MIPKCVFCGKKMRFNNKKEIWVCKKDKYYIIEDDNNGTRV